MPRPALILFARAPDPGRVKTRLAGRLGPGGAARLYEAFLRDAARVYPSPGRWRSILCAEPDPREARLAAIFGQAWTGRTQSSGSLGDRLRDAFEAEFRVGAPAVLAVGSDHPALPRRLLDEAFGVLADGAEAVLVPAEDGGYCAIGLGSVELPAAVFADIPWSTAGVLDATTRRLEETGTRYRLLETAYDVDRVEDLDRLRRDLAGRDPEAEDYPTATAQALGALT